MPNMPNMDNAAMKAINYMHKYVYKRHTSALPFPVARAVLPPAGRFDRLLKPIPMCLSVQLH
jgi:hypothetical protein